MKWCYKTFFPLNKMHDFCPSPYHVNKKKKNSRNSAGGLYREAMMSGGAVDSKGTMKSFLFFHLISAVLMSPAVAWFPAPATWRRPSLSTLTSTTASAPLFRPQIAAHPLVRMMDDSFADEGPFQPFDEADSALEKEMARELYDELRQGKPSLDVADFLVWEDIVDVMSTGVIDDETMQVIIEEVGVTDGTISFDQFFEVRR